MAAVAKQLTLFKPPKKRRKPKPQPKGYARGEFPSIAPPDLAQESALWLTGQRSIEAQRGKRYVPASVKHPGKMQPDVAAAIIDTYTKPGDVILDVMAGIGTTLVEGAERGRHVIGIELVRHWANVAYANAVRTAYRGATGSMRVICGDARSLPELLAGLVDTAVMSPPYGEALETRTHRQEGRIGRLQRLIKAGVLDDSKHGTWAGRLREQGGNAYLKQSGLLASMAPAYDADSERHQADAALMSPPFGDNIFVQRDFANMRTMEGRTDVPEAYDAALFSPPYSDTTLTPDLYSGLHFGRDAGDVDAKREREKGLRVGYDAMVASPAFGDIRQDGGKHEFGENSAMTNYTGEARIQKGKRDRTNVGNLKYGTMAKALTLADRLKAGETIPPEEWPQQDYLEAMALIYWHCLNALKPGGLCVLVLKDYRRKKRRVRLVSDTETLMEAVGFVLHDKALALTSSVQGGKVIVKVSPFVRVNARKPGKNGGKVLLPAGEEVLVFRKEAPR